MDILIQLFSDEKIVKKYSMKIVRKTIQIVGENNNSLFIRLNNYKYLTACPIR